jgi:hypothetical protein
MHRPFCRPLGAIFVFAACGLAGAPSAALAQPAESMFGGPGHWRLALSPYTFHFNPSDDHRSVWAIGVERQADTGWLYGGSYFRNSFGQPSGYLYLGQRYEQLFGRPPLYFQWSAGLLYGYRGEFKDKVPLNYNGFSPGALVSLGWELNRQSALQVNLLGDAGLMFQYSHAFR